MVEYFPITGMFDIEDYGDKKARWIGKVAEMFVQKKLTMILALELYNPFESMEQNVEVSIDGRFVTRISLLKGWGTYLIEEGFGNRIKLCSDKTMKPPGDGRNLAVVLGDIDTFDSREHLSSKVLEGVNKVLNETEYLMGEKKLNSKPQTLVIDFSRQLDSDKKNGNKKRNFISSKKDFIYNAGNIFDCSTTDFLSVDLFKHYLNELCSLGKNFSFYTSGKLLNQEMCKILSETNVKLLIPLDAASKKTYNSLHKNNFDLIIKNIHNLTSMRKKSRPQVEVIFTPTAINKKDFKDFFKLASHLSANAVILNPINTTQDKKSTLYLNNDARKLLSSRELQTISSDAEKLAKKYSLTVANNLVFERKETHNDSKKEGIFKKISSEGGFAPQNLFKVFASSSSAKKPVAPLCDKPWRYLYSLGAGIVPCEHTLPVVLDAKGDFEAAWNCETIQEMREYLARGELSMYCINRHSCPIVRKYLADKEKQNASK